MATIRQELSEILPCLQGVKIARYHFMDAGWRHKAYSEDKGLHSSQHTRQQKVHVHAVSLAPKSYGGDMKQPGECGTRSRFSPQLSHPELGKCHSFTVSCKQTCSRGKHKTYSLRWRDTLPLLSMDVHNTNIPEKTVWEKTPTWTIPHLMCRNVETMEDSVPTPHRTAQPWSPPY